MNNKPLSHLVFVNMCQSPKIQIPQNYDGKPISPSSTQTNSIYKKNYFLKLIDLSIPLSISPPRYIKDTEKPDHFCTVIDCVFNPWVIKQALKNTIFFKDLCESSLQWIEDDKKICCNKSISLPVKEKYIGLTEKGETVRHKIETKEEKEERKKKEESGKMINDTSELLKEVKKSQIKINNEIVKEKKETFKEKEKKVSLIEEVNDNNNKKKTIKYSMSYLNKEKVKTTNKDEIFALEIIIDIPEEYTMNDVILDVNETELKCEMKGKDILIIKFPVKCNSNDCIAKYRKKFHNLKLILNKL